MKKILFLSFIAFSVWGCKNKELKTKTSITKPKKDSFIPYDEYKTKLKADLAKDTPTVAQIKEWEQQYPFFNGKTKSDKNEPLDLNELVNEIKSSDNSLSARAEQLNHEETVDDIYGYHRKEIFARKKFARGEVTLEIPHFVGNSVPFTGKVIGNIKALYVNGQKIKIDENPDDLFFRLNIDVKVGYNRIPVKAINKTGKALNTYMEFNY